MPTPDQLMPDVAVSNATVEMLKGNSVLERESKAVEDHCLWALADLHIPQDVRDAAERWKLSSTLQEMWRQAFIAGWRESHRTSNLQIKGGA